MPLVPLNDRIFHFLPHDNCVQRFALPLLLAATALAQSGVIAVYSNPATVPVGTTRQFTTYVSVSPNTIVWSVNSVPGGNATYGTVSSSGLFTAPLVAPMDNVIQLRATSTVYPSKYGTSTVTLVQPTPYVYGCSPLTMPAGEVSLKITGVGYTTTSVVKAGDTALATTYVSAQELHATGTLAAGGYAVRVFNPGPGSVLSGARNITVTAPAVKVTVTPSTATLGLNQMQPFTASVTNATNPMVTWTVNGAAGGNSTVGTVSPSGMYTAPAALPSPATVTVRATSVATPSAYAQATVTLTAPTVKLTVSPATAALTLGQSQAFAATVVDSMNTAVYWSVNGVAGGNPTLGTITTAGLYTAPAALPSPATVTVRATAAASSGAYAQATVTLTDSSSPPPPPPPPSGVDLASARFLEQAAFGPTSAEIARVQQYGIGGWLDNQFEMGETPIPMASDTGRAADQSLYRMAMAPDQLRQRAVYALSQIIVVSRNKNIYAPEIVPWLQILSRNAFGNYRTLLKEITLSSQMGKYLDLANSTKPGTGGGANENLPRELMQLFSIGLVQLNPDGSPKLDAAGKTIPTYTQTTVQQMALALTGWTYPGAPGGLNWESFTGPLEARENYHDQTAKTLVGGVTAPAGQTAMQDLDAAIDAVFQHPNVGPFLATRLIRATVTGNPTPGYIQRVAAVFDNNGQGVRGDLRAVWRAIFTDAEARQDTPPASFGRLKEPLYYFVALTRALGGSITDNTQLGYLFQAMGQQALTAPSVFNFYSPLYHVPGQPLFGPEFQIYSPTESVLRANLTYQILNNSITSAWHVDTSPFSSVAGNANQLLDAVDRALLYGRMPAAMRSALLTAMASSYDNNQRMMTALYLTALSGQYAVQY